jgi:D-aminopeptidase
VAAADAVEEAILNAMLGADDLSGCGNTVLALKPERLLAALQQVGWKAS